MDKFIRSCFDDTDCDEIVNIEKVSYFKKEPHGDDRYRIYFSLPKGGIFWIYNDKLKRDYEYNSLLNNYSQRVYVNEDSLAKFKKDQEELNKIKLQKIEEEVVFIYRKDNKFFVSRDEWKVQKDNKFYEQGVLLNND